MENDFFKELDPKVMKLLKGDLAKLPEKWDFGQFYWGTSKIVDEEKIVNRYMFGPLTISVNNGIPINNPLTSITALPLVYDDKLVGYMDTFTIMVVPQDRTINTGWGNQGIQVLRNNEIVVPQTENFPGPIRSQNFARWMFPSPEPINVIFEPVKFKAQDRMGINVFNTSGQRVHMNISAKIRLEKA